MLNNKRRVYENNLDKNSGFTLAEVLITLGIIGVVAAMTIPTLMTNLKAQKLHSQFLRSYSLVQQAFKHMEADDVSLNPKDYPTRTFYKTYMNYFTGTSDCGFAGEKCRGAAGTAYKGMDGTMVFQKIIRFQFWMMDSFC